MSNYTDKYGPLAPIGSRWRLVLGDSQRKPWPNALVEVTSEPRSGDYRAGDQKVKIGPVVTVRYLEAHTCPMECSSAHEIGARLDQLQPLPEAPPQ